MVLWTFGVLVAVGQLAGEDSFQLPKDEVGLGLLTSHQSDEVRAAAVAALRKRGAVEIDRFLDDSVREVREAAVKGIYDEPVTAAFSQLARRAELIAASIGADDDAAIAQRAILAAQYLGREQDAAMLARIAATRTVNLRPRADALKALQEWNELPEKDPVTGKKRIVEEERVLLGSEDLEAIWNLFGILPEEGKGTQIVLFGLLVELAEKMEHGIAEHDLKPLLEWEHLPEGMKKRAAKLGVETGMAPT